MDLDGKRIVVTGAASGIGAALVRELARADTRIVAADLRPLPDNPAPDRVFAVVSDVSRPEALDRLFEDAVARLGGIDLFFANAGFAYIEQLGAPDWGHVADIFSTNVFHPIYAAQKMRALNGDHPHRVVATCSAMAFMPIPYYALYSSTKAALAAFARAHRLETRDAPTLTLVYPVATTTAFFSQGGRTAPVPWPAQSPETVARAIVSGVRRDEADIFPSLLFRLMLVLQRLVPWAATIYQTVQRRQLDAWWRNRSAPR